MKSIIIILFITLSVYASGQTGSIKGKVLLGANEPGQHATVALKENGKGTTSDKKGEFLLKNIKAGDYTLVVQYTGYLSTEQRVQIKPGEVTNIGTVTLKEADKAMPEIALTIITTQDQSEYVAKLPLKNMENPQVYNTIDASIMEEQVVTNFDDALKNAPGIEKLWESTGRANDGASYYSLRGFSVQPTLVNGLPGITNGSLDPANIERIEVIKGPSGTLFGSSLISYGGLINTVTKKPYDDFGGQFNLIARSFGLNRITADINTPLDTLNKLIVRSNMAYHSEQSFQDAGFQKSIFVAPSIKYKVNKKLTLDLSTEFLSAEGTNQTMLFLNRSAPLAYEDLDALDYDNYKSYTSNALSIKNPRTNLQSQLIYKINNHWTAQTAISRGSSKSDGYYTYLWDFADGTTFGRYLAKQNSTTYTTDFQENIQGDIEIGGMRHRMVIGLDYFQRNIVSNNTGWVGFGTIVDGIDNGDLTQSAADSALSGSAFSRSETKEQIYSAYFSDVVNITPQISIMASLRADLFNSIGNINDSDDNYDQFALSPKFGAVYQLTPDRLSLFANYMNGFSNVSPATVSDINGLNPTLKTFDPEYANQVETGIKSILLNGKLDLMLSYYDIMVSNKVMTDPSNPNNQIQGGKVQSKGVEISMNGAIAKGFNVLTGYSYNDSKVLENDESSIFAVVGRRPGEAGPHHLYNAWITYTLSGISARGLGFGFGVNGASERLIMDSDVTGRFSLPSYTILNASVFYKQPEYILTLKIDNIGDVEYYKGWSTINPQRPRSYSINFSYLF